MNDPRPDLLDDHPIWERLLGYVQKYEPPSLHGVLHGVRCGGAMITIGPDGARLLPRIDPEGKLAMWKNQEEWDADRLRYLMPVKDDLIRVLAKAKK